MTLFGMLAWRVPLVGARESRCVCQLSELDGFAEGRYHVSANVTLSVLLEA